jgi:predicted ATPase
MKTADSGLRRLPESEPIPDSAVLTGIFALTGDYRTIRYSGVSCTLKESSGLSYVHRLLQNPGKEFHALDLWVGPGIPPSEGQVAALSQEGEGFIPRHQGDLGPRLDPRAKREFKRAIKELKEEHEDLLERGDRERAEEIQDKIEKIEHALASSEGLNNRDRAHGSDAERARLNVTRAIRSALERVSDHHPVLGKLLNDSIRTGSYCSYVPNLRIQVEWQFVSDSTGAPIDVPTPLPPPIATAPVSQDQTLFVGRAAERAALVDRLRRAANGESGIVLIAGPAGIGKSRLSREIGSDARRLGFVTLAGCCYDREDSVPFIPVVEIFEAALAQASTPQIFRDDLDDEAAEITRLMPQLRRLFPEIPPSLQLSPEQARRTLFTAIIEVIARRSHKDPMLLLVEDVHWADEGTLVLLTHLARAMTKMRVLVMLTYRDDALDPAGPLNRTIEELLRLRVEQIPLHGLAQTAVGEMIQALSGREASAALVNLIWANSEGNPLFVEELLRHLERSAPDGMPLDGVDQAELNLPDSLRLMIGRRLARVSKETQKILATAAVIGRSFTFGLLEAATKTGADQLLELVEEAERAGLITSRLRYPDAQFRFAHELIRRAVLDELSVARKQRLHLSVAEAVEVLYPDTLEDQAEDLAHHLWNAGAAAERPKTIRYLQVAGAKAVQTAANAEAVGHFRKALQLVNSVPDSPERVQTELMLQMALAVPLFTMKGYASPDVEAVFARARHLCGLAGDSPQLFPVVWLRCLFHTARAECMTARDLAEQCLRLAEKAGDPVLLMLAHHMLGVSLSSLGEFAPSLEHLNHTISIYNPDQHSGLAAQYGHDFGVVARAQAALVLWYLGYPNRARIMSGEALSLARNLSHPLSQTVALIYASRLHVLSRDAPEARKRGEEALNLADEGDFAFWKPVANVFHGWALAQGPEVAEGITKIRAGLDACRASGSGVGMPSFLACLAESYGRARQPIEGIDALKDAYATVRQSGERWSEPELYRLEGELTLMLSASKRSPTAHAKRAEECFLRAIEIAQQQKAKLLELRATLSLYQLWASQGKRREALRRLTEVYSWFPERFDTRDLNEAAQLIESNS